MRIRTNTKKCYGLGATLPTSPFGVTSERTSELQPSSKIVETDTASVEFSRKFLRFTPHTFVLTVMCPLPPQCWVTRILKHWDRCNAQVNIGEGKTHTSVSRFLTRIIFSLKRGKSYCFTSRRNFGPLMEYTCFGRVQMRKKIAWKMFYSTSFPPRRPIQLVWLTLCKYRRVCWHYLLLLECNTIHYGVGKILCLF